MNGKVFTIKRLKKGEWYSHVKVECNGKAQPSVLYATQNKNKVVEIMFCWSTVKKTIRKAVFTRRNKKKIKICFKCIVIAFTLPF